MIQEENGKIGTSKEYRERKHKNYGKSRKSNGNESKRNKEIKTKSNRRQIEARKGGNAKGKPKELNGSQGRKCDQRQRKGGQGIHAEPGDEKKTLEIHCERKKRSFF